MEGYLLLDVFNFGQGLDELIIQVGGVCEGEVAKVGFVYGHVRFQTLLHLIGRVDCNLDVVF